MKTDSAAVTFGEKFFYLSGRVSQNPFNDDKVPGRIMKARLALGDKSSTPEMKDFKQKQHIVIVVLNSCNIWTTYSHRVRYLKIHMYHLWLIASVTHQNTDLNTD